MASSYPTVMVGALLKENREGADLTQAELAEALNVSSRTVRAWEAGTMPRPKHRRLLKELFAALAADAAEDAA